MARLNARQKRAAKRRAALYAKGMFLNPSTQPTDGFVRSSHKVKVANQYVPAVARAFSPKPLNWEGKGSQGKVVKGQLKPRNPASKSRFSGPVIPGDWAQPTLVQPTREIVQPDTTKAHLKRAWKGGRPIKED